MTPATIEARIERWCRLQWLRFGRSRFVRTCVHLGARLARIRRDDAQCRWEIHHAQWPTRLWWAGCRKDDE